MTQSNQSADKSQSVRTEGQTETRLRQYESVISQINDWVSIIDTDYRLRFANQRNLEYLQQTTDMLIGHHVGELIGDRFEEQTKAALDRCFAGNPVNCQQWIETAPGEQCYLDFDLAPYREEDGRISGAVVTIRNITDLKNAEDALRRQIRQQQLVTDMSTQFINSQPETIDQGITQVLQTIADFENVDRCYVLQLSDDDQTLINTHEWCADGVTGQIESVEITDIGKKLPWLAAKAKAREVIVVDDVDALPGEAELDKESLRQRAIQSFIVVPMMAGGTLKGFIGCDSVRAKRSWNSDTIALIKIVGEIFVSALERQHISTLLTYQASHDDLTGLVNRREFSQRLEHALSDVRAQSAPSVLCYLDLDQFKSINDRAGHMAGDQMLVNVANLLQNNIRGSDTVARLGGDEFGLLLTHCPLEKARSISEALLAQLADFRFVWQDQVFEISASIGLVSISPSANGITQLFSQADLACYMAKDLGRNRVYVYQIDDAELAQHQTELLNTTDVRDALANNRFRLLKHPIVPLGPTAQDKPYYEILLRLVDEEGNILFPKSFLPAAERYGLIHNIDRWVIQKIFAEHRQLFAESDSQIAINLSGSTLNDDTFLDFIQQQFAGSTLAPERVCFEIAETAVISNLNQISKIVQALRDLGCRFALDDFSSGLSSFSYLKHFPIDYIKIDGSFVKDMIDDPIDHAMVSAINHLGHAIGVKTIAEFVDNPSMIAALQKIGVDYMQGYAVAEPVFLE